MINYNVIKLCLIFLMTTTQLYCQKKHEIKEIFLSVMHKEVQKKRQNN